MDETNETASDKAAAPGRPVMVTTEHRGVFFGYLDERTYTPGAETVVLKRARNCLSWDRDVRGVFGLAVTGPGKQCRIGPAAAEIELRAITSVTPVEAQAVERWESAPWS
jgi:hypothetical protein